MAHISTSSSSRTTKPSSQEESTERHNYSHNRSNSTSPFRISISSPTNPNSTTTADNILIDALNQYLDKSCQNDTRLFCQKVLSCMQQHLGISEWRSNFSAFSSEIQLSLETCEQQWEKANMIAPSPREVKKEEQLIEERTEPWQIDFSSLTLGKKIAEGFFGEVYKGTLWGKKVAIKRLKFSSSIEHDELEKAKTIRKLKEEAAIMSSIRHPNVLLFMGLSSTLPNICLVTEFMENGSLYDVLQKRTVDDRTFFKMLVDICCGMNYLHNRSILHLDLKPLNLLVDENLAIKVSDFGISRITQGFDQKIKEHTRYGTILYMPPEVLGMGVSEETDGAPYFDYTYDIFSFGIMLFELLYMRGHPNVNFSVADSVGFDLIREPLMQRQDPKIPPWWPPILTSLIKCCTSNDPKHRPTFEVILKELDELKDLVTSEWFLVRLMAKSISELSTNPEVVLQLLDHEVWDTLDFFLSKYVDDTTVYYTLCAMIDLADSTKDVSKTLQNVIVHLHRLAYGSNESKKKSVRSAFTEMLAEAGHFRHFQKLLDSPDLSAGSKDEVLGILLSAMSNAQNAEKFVREGIIQYAYTQVCASRTRYNRILHNNTCSLLKMIVSHNNKDVLELFVNHGGLELLIYFVNNSAKDSVFLALQTLAEISVMEPTIATQIEKKGIKPIQMASRAYLGALSNKNAPSSKTAIIHKRTDSGNKRGSIAKLNGDVFKFTSNSFTDARDKLSNILDSSLIDDQRGLNTSADEEVVVKLWELLKEQVDLNRVDTAKLKIRLQQEFANKLAEQKIVIDNQINKIVGQMEPPSQITENIYLGSEWNSSHFRDLTNLNIQHILNLSPDSPNYYPDHFKYKNIRIDPSKPLSIYFDEVYSYLESVVQSGSSVLVHSHLGVGRSASLVISFLMKKEQWPLSRAFKYVKDRRPFIQINRLTMRSLMDIELSLGFEGSLGMSMMLQNISTESSNDGGKTSTSTSPTTPRQTNITADEPDVNQSYDSLVVLSPRLKSSHNRRYSAIV